MELLRSNRLRGEYGMKKSIIILAIAVTHLAVTKIISSITLSIFSSQVHESQMAFMGRIFMGMSKILYFPVMTMAWYPRQFFPGNLVAIPLFVNSLLWALTIYILFGLFKKVFYETEYAKNRRKRQPG